MENRDKDDSEIAAVLAHEVKNPIAIIKANIDSIKSVLPESVSKNIEIIDSAIIRLDKLVESYKIINDTTSDNELIYVEDMLIDIIEEYNISKPKIEFRYNCGSDLCLYGNYDKLSILFYNIYKNAVEAIDDRGEISTDVRAEKDNIVITISDSGKGIEDINSIGMPYYTTKSNGTGLGVLICKNIVKEHNGELYFKNNRVGSSAVIKLPINKKEAVAE